MMSEHKELFNEMEIDAIGEVLNISLGSAATSVSNMLDKRVDITTPSVTVVTFDEFEFSSLEPAIAVEITYTKGLVGTNLMLLKREDIRAILELLMSTEIPPEEFEVDELSISAICEVMNQMMGGSCTALAGLLGEQVDISTPVSYEVSDANGFKQKCFGDQDTMIMVMFKLTIETKLESEFLNVMPVAFAKRLVEGLFPSDSDDGSVVNEAAVQPGMAEQAPPQPEYQVPPGYQPQPGYQTPPPGYQPQPEYQVPPGYQPQPMYQVPPMYQPQPMYQASPPIQAAPKIINAKQPVMGSMESIDLGKLGLENPSNLDLVMSVPLQISVEIGRTRKPLKEILNFSQGALVVLDKLAGEHADLFVNNQCVAKGDVVVVDDNFGIRITEIVRDTEFVSGK